MSTLLNRLRIALKTSDADAHGLAAMETSSTVEAVRDSVTEFRPREREARVGVIFYQGGRCDPDAYAPLMRPLAEAGIQVFVPHMALRLAVTGANKAAGIMAANPHIERWFIGGHSMGGSMAAGFASKHQDELAGLFMVGSYAAAMHAMPDASLSVLHVHATLDSEVQPAQIEAQPERLPAHTRFVRIDGGDHYQFGSFRDEDVTATISRDEQQQQTITALLDFLQVS